MTDRSWKSLLDPGSAGTYFDFPLPARLAVTRRDPATARLIAELARLVYQPNNALRRTVLTAMRWSEVEWIERSFTQCGIYRAMDREVFAGAIVVFRGTDSLVDWIRNLDAMRAEWPSGGRVHRGFQQSYAMVGMEVLARARALGVPLVFAGHSLGGALALLASASTAAQAVFTFGAPRVGNAAFAASIDQVPVFRVVNHQDVVPLLPPAVGDDPYQHVGELVQLGDGDRGSSIAPGDLVRALLGGATRRLGDAPQRLADHSPINYVNELANAPA